MPFGVLLTLSTRLCLEPDRGVMLLLIKADTGDVNSVPLELKIDSGAGRRATGVARVGFWCCWGAGDRAAILGVRGGLFTLATVGASGCRWPATDARSYEGILAAIRG